MDGVVMVCELHNTVDEKLDDHEIRIRDLEKNSQEMRYKLLNIEKSQSDLKALFLDTNREHSKQLDGFMNRMANMLEQKITTDSETNSQIKLLDRRELWAVIALIVGAFLSYLPKILG